MKKELVGYIGVDAGLCWVGDPCYCVTPDCDEHPARCWGEFCDRLREEQHDERGVTAFPFRHGIDGLGVCVSTGYGDGVYPVYITRKDGRIASVEVKFL